jgi:hypothetical protein
VASAIALATAACGGGGGGDDDPPVDPPPVDPPIDPDPGRAKTIDAMRRAVTFMDQEVSYNGAYVWSYLASDRNKCWGEMEAYPTMCWMQPTGTPSVGNAILDAYHATGDETFYRAAERTALAMVEAQHPAGGWNYIYDFAGEDSLKRWYETIGINGWRLEEFQHYYGNATFDDATTAVSSQFMLRMYLEKRDPRFKTAIDKAIDFVVNSQFKEGIVKGGWPQRFPRYSGATQSMPAPNWPPTGPNWAHLQPGARNGDYIIEGPGGPQFGKGYTGVFCGMEDRDYTNFLTFNDDVIAENIKFLMICIFGLGRMDLKDPAVAAMDCVANTIYRYSGDPSTSTNPNAGTTPQCGWALQHLSQDTVDAYGVLRKAGSPAGARGYEARGISPNVSIANANLLFHFFRLTGNKRYLLDLADVFNWADTCALKPYMRAYNASSNPTGDPESILTNSHARVIELDSNRPRFVHRYGTNIWNGAYYFDYDWRNTPSHYGVAQGAATATPRATLARLSALTNDQIARMVAKSPLNVMNERPLPKYFSAGGEVDFPHLYADSVKGLGARNETENDATIDSLGEKNYWSSNQSNYTNPYTQNGSSTPYLGKEYMSRHVGDPTDTSPFAASATQMPNMPPYNTTMPPNPVPQVVNSSTFVSNLNNLTAFLAPVTAVTDPDYRS